MNIGFPFRIDGRGRTADAGEEAHVRQLIEQLLFTAPGERVNRPEFGTGVMQLIFAPNSREVAAATDIMIQGALQQYLGDIIQVEQVAVESSEATLRITVQYTLLRNRTRHVAQITREL